MRKLGTTLILTLILCLFTGCSYLKKMELQEEATKFNDIRVTFVTTQGDVNFFLYPEAAPITVANFINLGKRGYYNDNKIHRAVEGFIVQAGDPTETGTGGPGYAIPDEIVGWLDFYQPGILAMANAGPNTGGSQYFFTLYPADWLNKKHTVFGEIVSDADMNVIKKLEVGDIIKEVNFTGEVDFFMSLNKDKIDAWNAVLDTNFPNLLEYPVRNPEEFGDEVVKYQEELEKIYTPKEEESEEEKEGYIPRKIRAIEKSLTKEEVTIEEAAVEDIEEAKEVVEETEKKGFFDKLKFWEKDEVEVVEIKEDIKVDSPDKVEVEEIVEEVKIDELDELDETKEGFFDKLKFWKRKDKAVKEIG